ncbi:MATE family efflux transporter [Paenibacillus piri]|uniref:Probable multidrug resistance protein NorM n=1 Tax=Paenibacillus piri TaxID=2547395 RepID=A0A4R5KIB6_9BACL|nr:MATE family efflux transporter [Paenibacillus piri]TDF95211.1 MATE family efflux transporter [Paenibacillus piri]
MEAAYSEQVLQINLQAEAFVLTLGYKMESRAIYRNIVRRGWPLLIENVLLNFSTFFDIIMVGSLGAYAVTAVGITDQPLLIVNFILFGLNTVIVTKVSLFKGRNDAEQTKIYVANLIFLSLGISLFFSVLGLLFAPEIMLLMGAAPDIVPVSAGFFQFVIAGTFAKALMSAIVGALRGIGETKTSLTIIMVSNGSNIVFNYLFIYGNLGFPKMGVNGSGLATSLSFLVGLALCIIRLFFGGRDSIIRFRLHDLLRVRMAVLKDIFRSSLPVMWELVSVRIGVLVTAKFTISIGTLPFAAHMVVSNLLNLSFFIGTALATTVTTFVGESIGNNDPALAKQYIRATIKTGLAASSPFVLAFLFIPRTLAGIYTNDLTVIHMAVVLLGMTAFMQPFQCLATILFGAFRGYGDFKSPAKITSIGIVIIRPLLTFALVYLLKMSLVGAWIAIIIDEVFRFLAIVNKYRKQRVMEQRTE